MTDQELLRPAAPEVQMNCNTCDHKQNPQGATATCSGLSLTAFVACTI